MKNGVILQLVSTRVFILFGKIMTRRQKEIEKLLKLQEAASIKITMI